MTPRKATVSMKREIVSLFGKFMQYVPALVSCPGALANLQLRNGSKQTGVEFHLSSGRFRDQVIIRVTDYFYIGELADWQLAANEYAPVDVRRVGFSPPDEVSAFETAR